MIRHLPLALALALCTSAAAAGREPLTLAAAVDLALARHPSLAGAAARVDEARANLAEAESARGPIARLLLTAQHHGEPMPVTPIHGFGPALFPEFEETLLQAGLSVSYTLWDSGARRARMRQAEEQIAGGESRRQAARQAVIARVVAAWAAVRARAEAAGAAEQRVTALAAELERTAVALAAGRVAPVESLRAEAALAAAQAEASRATIALDAAERDLARLLGEPVEAARGAALDLASASAPPAVTAARSELQERALAASPWVEEARRQIAAALAARALARSAYFPELRTTGALQELGAVHSSFGTEWNVALQLSVPLWDGGQTDQRVARADARLASARADLAGAEIEAREAVDRALAARAETAARLTALERAELRLVEVARIQKLLLDTGAGTQVDYLAAEAELAATRAAIAETRAGALVAAAELARATGDLETTWIASWENLP